MNVFVGAARFVIRWELLWLALFSPFLFFPRREWLWALLGIPLLWLVRWVAWRRFIPRTPLDVSLLLLLVMVGVSQWVTFDPLLSLPKVTGVLLGVAVYYALAEMGEREKGVLLAVGVLIAVSTAMAAISLFTTNWTAKFPGVAQAIAFLPSFILALPGSPPEGFNPNGVAGALLFVFPLLVVLAWPLHNPVLQLIEGRLRWVFYGVLALLAGLVTFTLVLTQSRGGYLGLVVALLVLLILPHRWLRLAAGAGLLLAAISVILLDPLPLFETVLAQLPLASGGATGDALSSLESRTEIWSRAVYAMQDFPFTGMGMGTFRRIVPVLYPLFTIAPDSDIGHPHNHLLAAGVDLGIPGLVAYVSLWIGVAMMLARVWGSGLPAAYRRLALGIGAGLVGHFVWGMTDSNVLGAKAAFPFWLTLGAAAASHRFACSQEAEEKQIASGPVEEVAVGPIHFE